MITINVLSEVKFLLPWLVQQYNIKNMVACELHLFWQFMERVGHYRTVSYSSSVQLSTENRDRECKKLVAWISGQMPKSAWTFFLLSVSSAATVRKLLSSPHPHKNTLDRKQNEHLHFSPPSGMRTVAKINFVTKSLWLPSFGEVFSTPNYTVRVYFKNVQSEKDLIRIL